MSKKEQTKTILRCKICGCIIDEKGNKDLHLCSACFNALCGNEFTKEEKTNG